MKDGTAVGPSIGARLKGERSRLGQSQQELADAARLPLSTYRKYENDERIPGGEALAALAKVGVNLSRVLIGSDDAPGPRAEQPGAAYSVSEPAPGFVYLPLYELSAGAAREGRIVGEARPVAALAFREDWIRHELHASPEHLSLIYVEGDSMESELRAGDIILVDTSVNMPTREGIYVVRLEDALLVKKVQRLPGGVVKLISGNAAYEPVLLPLPTFDPGGPNAIVGRVVWACRRL